MKVFIKVIFFVDIYEKKEEMKVVSKQPYIWEQPLEEVLEKPVRDWDDWLYPCL